MRWDLLLFQRQLPVAIQLVDRQPDLGIVTDHIAKPVIRKGRFVSGLSDNEQKAILGDNAIRCYDL
jgi:predicted TIM-barrel fold metal-dependent hydrolase